MFNAVDGRVITAATLEVAPHIRHLYAHLVSDGFIAPIREFDTGQKQVLPGEVLKKIQSGDAAWEDLVPAARVDLIKKRKLFGYRGR